MTRSFFKGVTIRAAICVLVTLTFLFSCLSYARSVARSGQQEEYRELYGSLLMASEYRSLKTEVLDNHEDILAVYSAYDESGRLIGYILDVQTQNADGMIHTQMSISEDGENLTSGSGGSGSSALSASGGFSSRGFGGSTSGMAGIVGETAAASSSSSAKERSTLERSRVATAVGPGAYFI